MSVDLEKLKRIVARTQAGESVRGTAFLVGPELALTCAHCLGPRSNRASRIVLDFGRTGGPRIENCEVIDSCDELDVALVAAKGAKSAELFTLAENTVRGERWEGFAFPKPADDDGLLLSGRVDDSEARAYGKAAIQLHCDQALDAVAGASGGPVVVKGLIVGMLTKQLLGYGEGGVVRPVFKTIYALPLEGLSEKLPDMPRVAPRLQKATKRFDLPVRVLVIYGERDRRHAKELSRRLATLEAGGPVAAAYSCVFGEGTNVGDAQVTEAIEQAHIIVVLVSKHLLSLEAYRAEVRRAKALRGGARARLITVAIGDAVPDGSIVHSDFRLAVASGDGWEKVQDAIVQLAASLRAPDEDSETTVFDRARKAGDAVANGRYVLERMLGKGGFGEVWQAQDAKMARGVAIKVLRPPFGDEQRARFIKEGKIAAGVSHPNCLIVHDALELEDGTPALVSELLEGQSLAEMIGGSGRLEPRRAAQLLLPVVDALSHLHDKGIVHRDLKPANVFETTEGLVKVLDFGLAKQRGGSPPSGHTGAHVVMGTLRYMSPEQVDSFSKVGPAGDVFSLGVILYRVLAGAVPFRSKSLIDHIRRIERLDEHAFDHDLPAEVEPVLRAMLSAEPVRRPTLQEVRACLEALRDGSERSGSGSKESKKALSGDASEPDGGSDPDEENGGGSGEGGQVPRWIQIAGIVLVPFLAVLLDKALELGWIVPPPAKRVATALPKDLGQGGEGGSGGAGGHGGGAVSANIDVVVRSDPPCGDGQTKLKLSFRKEGVTHVHESAVVREADGCRARFRVPSESEGSPGVLNIAAAPACTRFKQDFSVMISSDIDETKIPLRHMVVCTGCTWRSSGLSCQCVPPCAAQKSQCPTSCTASN